VTAPDVLPAAVVVAIGYLLAAYAIGGPAALVRSLVALVTERRSRYRGRPDDVLAGSRFTIPVTIVLPAAGDEAIVEAVEHALALNYPEFELVVVNDGTPQTVSGLRERYLLSACEMFYRRSIPTVPTGAIYRSTVDPRLLVVDAPGVTRGAALNCGVNLARYRYVCCADVSARYTRDALLMAMQPATDDPAVVVGVTTSLSGSSGAGVPEPRGLAALLHKLGGLRAQLGRGGRRRLRLSADGLPGFTLWRRDAVVEAGGFATDVGGEHVDLTLRVHRHMLQKRLPYRIVHVGSPVGSVPGERTMAALMALRLERQQSIVRVLWRARGMLLNPRYGRVGLVDLPSYVLSTTVVPWFELACMVLLPFAVIAGVLTALQLLAVFVAIAAGNGVLLNTAMLLSPPAVTERTLMWLLALGPLEVFVSRPLQLYSRLVGLARALAPRTR
jgi:cellulose synthase/poly-beta-1,6-N-acetylglucosamine synthase-like glycosyltransferase